mgnify:CR=1 FL=1
MHKFRPGQEVTIHEQKFRIAATNHEGKMILVPAAMKEGVGDMMMRLQSTRPVEPADFDPKKKP